MKPDILIHENALRNAIHNTFALVYANEYEEAGHSIPGETCLAAWAPRQCDLHLMPIAWYLIGRVEQAWGCPVGLVFHHAGIRTEEQQEDALSDLFLGLQGHGVTLDDDHGKHIIEAERILNRTFDATPFEVELECLHEIAREQLERKFITPAAR